MVMIEEAVVAGKGKKRSERIAIEAQARGKG
jgi:hypothetical protein